MGVNVNNGTPTPVSVSNGGTGQTSLSAHCVLIGEGMSGISVVAQGTAGQVLTSQGASADPAMLDPIGAVNGQSVLGSVYTFSTTAGAFEDVGPSVSLPSAGTYLVGYFMRGRVQGAGAGSFVTGRLYNNNDVAAVANSEGLVVYAGVAATLYLAAASVTSVVTIATAKTIKLQAACTIVGAVTAKTVDSDANGRTGIWYAKINYV